MSDDWAKEEAYRIWDKIDEQERHEIEKALLAAFDRGFKAGMNHVNADKSKVSIHGTDGCMNSLVFGMLNPEEKEGVR